MLTKNKKLEKIHTEADNYIFIKKKVTVKRFKIPNPATFQDPGAQFPATSPQNSRKGSRKIEKASFSCRMSHFDKG